MGHHHHHHHEEGATKNIKTAFFLNLSFTLIEIIGGIYTNSLAIVSDAVHDLGDSISLGMSWYFQKISTKKANSKYSYGYKRFSLLGAIINSIILIIGTVFIIKEAIPRIINPQAADAHGMMWLAILGVLVNGAAVLKLKKGSSINERVVSLHLLEDVLGWIAVLIASIIMQFWNVPILDPILSLAIACYVLFNVFKNLKESISIILQRVPDQLSVKAIEKKVIAMKGIKSVHDCHLWTMDGEYHVLSMHLVLNDPYQKETTALKNQVRHLLKQEFHIEHCTLELDQNPEDCAYKDCN
ncbi:cation transporter [Polaribacter pacificus]|uniref:Cation transporter n=1 Tax=Polaribacter pacificus TaxID=1775173 RepID=A0A917HZL7_9FLAO|nr:cation diffusion facilitator family transporter [Polaribacter pacificus]GGG98127.1 cation transporter [Polaribacter pacificus]